MYVCVYGGGYMCKCCYVLCVCVCAGFDVRGCHSNDIHIFMTIVGNF